MLTLRDAVDRLETEALRSTHAPVRFHPGEA
jgi:hypothetical protein